MADHPIAPWEECPDERLEGVVLLNRDGEIKTTADRLPGCWRIVDWELEEFDGEPMWFARSWFTVSDHYISVLAFAPREKTP